MRHVHVPAFNARLAPPRVEVHAAPAPRLDHLLGREVRRELGVVHEHELTGFRVARRAVVHVERRRKGKRVCFGRRVTAPRRLRELRFSCRARVSRGRVHSERFLELAHRGLLVAHLGASARAPPRRRGGGGVFDVFSSPRSGGRFGCGLKRARRLVHAERLHARGVRGHIRLALTLVGAQRVAPGGLGCLSARGRSGRAGQRRAGTGGKDTRTRHRSENSAPSRAMLPGDGLNAPGGRRDAGRRDAWPATRTLAGIRTTRKRLLGRFT